MTDVAVTFWNTAGRDIQALIQFEVRHLDNLYARILYVDIERKGQNEDTPQYTGSWRKIEMDIRREEWNQ